MASDLVGLAVLMVAGVAYVMWDYVSRLKHEIVSRGYEIKTLTDELHAKMYACAELERNYLTCINADECNDLRKQLQQSQLVCNAYREQIDAMKLEWAEMSDRLGTVVKGVTSD